MRWRWKRHLAVSRTLPPRVATRTRRRTGRPDRWPPHRLSKSRQEARRIVRRTFAPACSQRRRSNRSHRSRPLHGLVTREYSMQSRNPSARFTRDPGDSTLAIIGSRRQLENALVDREAPGLPLFEVPVICKQTVGCLKVRLGLPPPTRCGHRVGLAGSHPGPRGIRLAAARQCPACPCGRPRPRRRSRSSRRSRADRRAMAEPSARTNGCQRLTIQDRSRRAEARPAQWP